MISDDGTAFFSPQISGVVLFFFVQVVDDLKSMLVTLLSFDLRYATAQLNFTESTKSDAYIVAIWWVEANKPRGRDVRPLRCSVL